MAVYEVPVIWEGKIRVRADSLDEAEQWVLKNAERISIPTDAVCRLVPQEKETKTLVERNAGYLIDVAVEGDVVDEIHRALLRKDAKQLPMGDEVMRRCFTGVFPNGLQMDVSVTYNDPCKPTWISRELYDEKGSILRLAIHTDVSFLGRHTLEYSGMEYTMNVSRKAVGT